MSDPIVGSLYGPRDWPEDFMQENGLYESVCCKCKKPFIGNKRRLRCKVCKDSGKSMSEHTDTERLDWPPKFTFTPAGIAGVFINKHANGDFRSAVAELESLFKGYYEAGRNDAMKEDK